jgi:uncharacterized protein
MILNDKESVLLILRSQHMQLSRFGVRRYGLFGSFVRNEQRPDSDLDILIEFEPSQKNFKSFMQLAFFLEDLLGRKVDILTPESLSPFIGPAILKEVEYVAIGA